MTRDEDRGYAGVEVYMNETTYRVLGPHNIPGFYTAVVVSNPNTYDQVGRLTSISKGTIDMFRVGEKAV